MRRPRLLLVALATAVVLALTALVGLGCGGERRPCSAPVHSLDQASSAEPER